MSKGWRGQIIDNLQILIQPLSLTALCPNRAAHQRQLSWRRCYWVSIKCSFPCHSPLHCREQLLLLNVSPFPSNCRRYRRGSRPHMMCVMSATRPGSTLTTWSSLASIHLFFQQSDASLLFPALMIFCVPSWNLSVPSLCFFQEWMCFWFPVYLETLSLSLFLS